MDPFSTTAPHPLLACADEIEAALKNVADVSPTFMPTEAKAEALLRLSRVVDQAEALRLRVIASAGDVAEVDASPNVASWLAPRTRTDHRPNHHRERLAVALDRRWTRVAAGLSEGLVNLAQAEVIVRALDALGDEVDRELLDPGRGRAGREGRRLRADGAARPGRPDPRGGRARDVRRRRARCPGGGRTPGVRRHPTVVPRAWRRQHGRVDAPPRCGGVPAAHLPRGVHLTPPEQPPRDVARRGSGGADCRSRDRPATPARPPARSRLLLPAGVGRPRRGCRCTAARRPPSW